ncbi:DUF1801 domain-containing protein [Arthrobacter sp. GMC3]|uniref:DUF1801 domain-containing protein n=1 Tax=Arthrobacter sp. GMC3 TaxID=2058894 RepID=UPI000CE326BA|nr:DUF1801 domain-containing protein [Arthrobacter sp. GMC3]
MTNSKSANKTHVTNVDVEEFLATVDTSEVRRADAHTLLAIMREETGQEPRMWGPSIIGFGQYHYKYASGREGDAAAAGFSPRKANLVIYGLSYAPDVEHLLARLGKFKAGAACVYVNKLADIDVDVLRELIRTGYQHITNTEMQSLQSQKR